MIATSNVIVIYLVNNICLIYGFIKKQWTLKMNGLS